MPPDTIKAPLVSVYLPTRNRAGLLREAAGSVLSQSFTDFELLIVDDASTDETPSVIADLVASDSRVRGLRLSHHGGAPAARNHAVAEARGELVTGLDDDDLFLPTRLETLLAAYSDSLSLVCSPLIRWRRGGWPERRTLRNQPTVIDLDKLLHGNTVGNQALMSLAKLRAVGGFDTALVASQDYDLWVRMVATYGVGRRAGPATYIFREGLSDSISTSTRFADGARAFTEKHRWRMSRSQLRSQRLLHKVAAKEPLGWRDVVGCFAWPTINLWAYQLVLGNRFIGSLHRRLQNMPPTSE